MKLTLAAFAATLVLAVSATVLATLLALPAAAATITANEVPLTPIQREYYCLAHVNIEGSIERGDYEHLRAAFATLVCPPPRAGSISIWLNSPGGLVGEALRMADLIHAQKRVSTGMIPNALCASACVLLFYAPTLENRSCPLLGDLRVHRAVGPDGVETAASIEVTRIMVKKLREFDVEEDIIAKLLDTSPNRTTHIGGWWWRHGVEHLRCED